MMAIMSTNRRNFLKLSALAGGSLGIGLIADSSNLLARTVGQAAKPLRILILGGTGFTGPFQVRYALSRGHKVTVFNRGQTHPGELAKEAERLIGDRNGQLDALKGRQWDVVIDIPTTLPVWVRDVARILKGNVDRYVFTSTTSVYSDNKPGMDENGPLAKYEGVDAMKETQATMRASPVPLYAPLKVLSEREAEKWFPGKTLIVRPGLIVGPGDESDRFTYWPVRIDRGGEILAPGDPDTDTVQFIDARDLAEWTIRMAEQGTTGIFNATGPSTKLSMGEMLRQIKKVTNAESRFTWVDTDFLLSYGVSPWNELPVWVAPRGPEQGFKMINIKKALKNGLTFRPIPDTARATVEWFKKQSPERQARLRSGMTAEREAAVLTAWRAHKK
jgi:nucleoside-diphosphate-sugar epimerase